MTLPEAEELEYLRIPDSLIDGNWFIVEGEVNLDDLCAGGRETGRIIRMKFADSIKYIPAPNDVFERVAGMISDCES